jgi:hypothetical protein
LIQKKKDKDKEAIEKKNLKNIITTIKTKESEKAIKKVITARRLLNRNILLLILTENIRIALKKSNDWLRAIIINAKI